MHAASLPSGCLRLSLSPSIIVDSISGVIPAHNLNHPTHGMDRSKYTNLGRALVDERDLMAVACLIDRHTRRSVTAVRGHEL